MNYIPIGSCRVNDPIRLNERVHFKLIRFTHSSKEALQQKLKSISKRLNKTNIVNINKVFDTQIPASLLQERNEDAKFRIDLNHYNAVGLEKAYEIITSEAVKKDE